MLCNPSPSVISVQSLEVCSMLCPTSYSSGDSDVWNVWNCKRTRSLDEIQDLHLVNDGQIFAKQIAIVKPLSAFEQIKSLHGLDNIRPYMTFSEAFGVLAIFLCAILHYIGYCNWILRNTSEFFDNTPLFPTLPNSHNPLNLKLWISYKINPKMSRLIS